MTHAAFRTTTSELAQRLNAELRGPGDLILTRLDTLEAADASALTFIRDAKNATRWASSRAGAALISRAATSDPALTLDVPGRTLLIVDDADRALITLLDSIAADHPRPSPGVHPTAVVDPSAHIAPTAVIGPHCTIGAGASIGDQSHLHAGVVVYPRCTIGSHCTLHANVVIGADGFGYRPSPDGRSILKVPHVGIVEIHDHVEIGANTTIDRAKFGATIVGAGTKIDNLVQIGHNVRIGRSCIICGCAALAGSVVVNDGATIAGGVGIADNITIGAGAKVGARSGVMDDIPAGESWVGYPARPAKQTFRILAALNQLPDVMAQMKKLMRSGE